MKREVGWPFLMRAVECSLSLFDWRDSILYGRGRLQISNAISA